MGLSALTTPPGPGGVVEGMLVRGPYRNLSGARTIPLGSRTT